MAAPNPDASMPTDAIAALRRGSKIEAIKILREARNIGLKEAKDIVEDYLRGQPTLQAELANAQSESGRNFLLAIAMLAVFGFLAYHFLVRK